MTKLKFEIQYQDKIWSLIYRPHIFTDDLKSSVSTITMVKKTFPTLKDLYDFLEEEIISN